MSGRIRRNSVYIATIVAMLAMVGGFTIASYGGSLSFGAPTNTSSGTGNLPGPTIWTTSGAALTVVTGGGAACTASSGASCAASSHAGNGAGFVCAASSANTLALTGSSGSSDTFAAAGSSASSSCTSGDYWAQMTFTTGAASGTDLFTITPCTLPSGGGTCSSSNAAVFTVTLSGGSTETTLDFEMDLGSTNGAYESIIVSISGS